jgi:hypothetical protein
VALFALALPMAADARPIPTSCGARDLLPQVKTEAPEAYQRFQRLARNVPNGDGLLWRIEKAGRAPSYLFGTMHSTDPRLNPQIARVEARVRRSRSVAVEIAELVTPGLKEEASRRLALAGRARSGNALAGLHPAANRALVETALMQRGIAPDRAELFESWFLIVTLSSPLCEAERRKLGLISVDERIGVAAARAGRPPIGLETLDTQIAALRQIGGWNPSDALIETARGYQGLIDMRETMLQAYVGDRLGELAMISRLPQIVSGEAVTLEQTGFTRVLLDARHAGMRDAALPLLDKGGAFIAVGALHLPGQNGLVQMFRDAGYRVSVVK